MIELSAKTLAFGHSIFMKEVVIPVSETIEEVAKESPCSQDVELSLTSRPTASLSGLDALIGIVIYLAGWATTKFLDEVYDAKLGPTIKNYLRPYIQKSGSNKKYSVTILAKKRDFKASVLICCIGSSLMEIESGEKLIPKALILAENLIDSTSENSVFIYTIENGKINVSPEAYKSLDSALNGLKRMYPAKHPRLIKLKN